MFMEDTSRRGPFTQLALIAVFTSLGWAAPVSAQTCTTNPPTSWDDHFVAADGSTTDQGARAATVGMTECGDFIVAFQVGSDARALLYVACPD